MIRVLNSSDFQFLFLIHWAKYQPCKRMIKRWIFPLQLLIFVFSFILIFQLIIISFDLNILIIITDFLKVDYQLKGCIKWEWIKSTDFLCSGSFAYQEFDQLSNQVSLYYSSIVHPLQSIYIVAQFNNYSPTSNNPNPNIIIHILKNLIFHWRIMSTSNSGQPQTKGKMNVILFFFYLSVILNMNNELISLFCLFFLFGCRCEWS